MTGRMESVPQSPVATSGPEGWAHTPVERDTDLSLLPLNNRCMKLTPEKGSCAPGAQTRVMLGDPERAGLPPGEDRVQYGRVTTSCPHPTPTPASTATAALRYSSEGGGSHL